MRSRKRYVYERFPPSNKPYNRDRFQDFHELVTESASPHRVILRVPTWKLEPACLRSSAWGLFEDLIPDPKKRPIKFEMVALSVRDEASHLVIDVNNFNNDFVSAEKTKTVIPTYYCRNWDDCYIYLVRTPQHDEAIAKRLEVLHRRSRSGAKVPLFENHTKLVGGYPCTSDIVF